MHHAIVDSLFRYVKHLQLVLFKTLELLNITRSVSVSEKSGRRLLLFTAKRRTFEFFLH
jgi:hypothetical protein